jgi:hypothetical protein
LDKEARNDVSFRASFYFISSRGKTRPLGVRWGLETSFINESDPVSSSVTGAAATAISAATAAAAATAAISTAAATATGFLSAGERLIHVESSAFDLFAIHAGDGRLPFLFRGHLHEPKPLGLTGAPVFYDRNGFNRPECCERLPQVIFGNFIRQISCIDFHTDLLLLFAMGNGGSNNRWVPGRLQVRASMHSACDRVNSDQPESAHGLD